MATSFNPTYRHMRGSGRWLYRIVNADGTTIVGQDWLIGPAIKESNQKDDTAEEEYEIESGETFYQEGKRSIEWSGMFAQNDPDTKALMTKTLRGKYVAILKEEAIQTQPDGTYPYLFYPVAKAIPSIDYKLPGGEVSFKFRPAAVSASYSLDLATVTGTAGMKGNITGTINLAPGEAYLDFNKS